jgi:Asp-tRNA(Asn)/Glu-tRNA(Gln) amidotransferase A subunit family amidase
MLTSAVTGPADFHDAPTAVQIIGRRQHDEELMAITVLVDEILRS